MKLTITVLLCYAWTSGYIDLVDAQQCLDPSNPDFCVKADYNRDRLPPNPPLNVTMNLVISVSILKIHHHTNAYVRFMRYNNQYLVIKAN